MVVAGSKEEIHNLLNIESNRVIEIYNECKRAEKQAQRTVIVQNQTPVQSTPVQVDVIDQIKKLSDLKDMGILTEDEFNAKKAELLSKI